MPMKIRPHSNKRIFAFTGLPGVGKSAVVQEFSADYGFPVVNMGEEMKAQYQSMPFGDDHEKTPTGTWEMAQSLRVEHGSAGPAIVSTSRIAAGFVESNVVLVDGIRSIEEIQFFKDTFDCPVHAVAVTADEDTRLERFTERGGYYEAFEEMEDSEQAAEAMAEYEMIGRTKRENEVGLSDAIEYANYSISNNGTLRETGIQLARLMDDFRPLL